jgi:hypothetical protein
VPALKAPPSDSGPQIKSRCARSSADRQNHDPQCRTSEHDLTFVQASTDLSGVSRSAARIFTSDEQRTTLPTWGQFQTLPHASCSGPRLSCWPPLLISGAANTDELIFLNRKWRTRPNDNPLLSPDTRAKSTLTTQRAAGDDDRSIFPANDFCFHQRQLVDQRCNGLPSQNQAAAVVSHIDVARPSWP